MDPKEISNQVKNDEVFLLDVREKYEWDSGHISGAKNISVEDLNEETLSYLPKDKPIYIYCRSGSRAESAKFRLNDLGFEKAQNIGGILEWQENGGELIK